MNKNQEIIEKIKTLHPNLEVVEFRGWKSVIVRNKYGECDVQLHSLLQGSSPTITSAIDKTAYYKSRLKEAQPDVTLLSEYKGGLEKVRISTKYGDCICLAGSLLLGKPVSIDVAVNKSEYYKIRANEIHNNRYDYSKLKYINGASKVTITCKKHGDFEQDATTHLKGKGCRKCAYARMAGGWYNNYENSQKPSNMYVISLRGNGEHFLKFGVAVNLNNRIRAILQDCKGKYTITIVKVIEGTAEYCSKLESKFRKIVDLNPNRYIKYEPEIYFQGRYECFKLIKKQ